MLQESKKRKRNAAAAALSPNPALSQGQGQGQPYQGAQWRGHHPDEQRYDDAYPHTKSAESLREVQVLEPRGCQPIGALAHAPGPLPLQHVSSDQSPCIHICVYDMLVFLVCPSVLYEQHLTKSSMQQGSTSQANVQQHTS